MDPYLDRNTQPMMQIFDTIAKWVQINLLFVGGTLVGGVIFGFFPALFASAATIRSQMIDGEDDGLYKTFSTYYKTRFWKANALGLFMVIMAMLTTINLVFVYDVYWQSDALTVFGVIFTMAVLLMAYGVSAVLLYIPITHVYFTRYGIKDTIKFSLLSTLGTPLLTIKLLAVALVSVLFFALFRSAIPFLGVSVPLSVMIRFAHRRYRKFFVFHETDTGLSIMNIRFIRDYDTVIMRLEQMLEGRKVVLERTQIHEEILAHPAFHSGLSHVLYQGKDPNIHGVTLIKHDQNGGLELALCIAERGKEEAVWVQMMLAVLQKHATGSGHLYIRAPLNQTVMHPSSKVSGSLVEHLVTAGYEKQDDHYRLTLRRP